MTLRHLLSLILFLTSTAGVFGHSRPCHAQPARAALRDELPAEARRDWDAARELYEARDFGAALVHFQRAYDVSQNPRTLFNVGVCHKDLAEYARAIRVWERALAEREPLAPGDVTKLDTAIKALRPFVSTLEVQSNQAGAVLTIDGYEVGRTPLLEPVSIDVGRRVVRLSKPDFLPEERTVEVTQHTPVSLSLELRPVSMTSPLTVAIAGAAQATLIVDGREIGTAPYQGEVTIGAHTFEVRAPGFEPARHTTEVVYGRPLKLSLNLVEQRSEGKLRVHADHPRAEIRVDGVLKGHGRWEGLVTSGGHELMVSLDGYEAYIADISLGKNQERALDVTLQKSQSWVWWTVSLAAVIGGGAVATAFIVRSSDEPAVSGTLDPGLVSF